MSFIARDVKDKIQEYTRRFKLVPVAGQDDTYDLEQVTGVVTELGTAINKAYLQPIEDYLGEIVEHLTASIPTTGWSGSAPPYSRTITVLGMKNTDVPIVDTVMTGTFATDEAITGNWGNIYRITTGADSITVYAFEIPEVEIPIQLKVVR